MWNQFNKIFATWIASLILTFGITVDAQGDGNLLLNGDFEENDMPQFDDLYNLPNEDFNALMHDVTAYGATEGLDIMTLVSGFGEDPQSGNWKIAGGLEVPDGRAEAFSFSLAEQIVQGDLYYLEFYMERLMTFDQQFDGGSVAIGLSNMPTSFGIEIYQSPDATLGWSEYSKTFFAPFFLNYLTVRIENSGDNWIGLDNFSLRRLILADVNQDGSIDLLDVAPFVELLTSGIFLAEADINQDGFVDLLDVQPFVDLLSGV